MYLHPALLILLAVLLTAGGYIFGWATCAYEEHKNRARDRARLRRAERQKHDLAQWVRENWPDQSAAYEYGIDEGFQQGLTQAGDLEGDDAAA